MLYESYLAALEEDILVSAQYLPEIPSTFGEIAT
jgi:hypothetical protein